MSDFEGRTLKTGMAFALGAALLLTGCGDDDVSNSPAATTSPNVTTTPEVTATQATVTDTQATVTDPVTTEVDTPTATANPGTDVQVTPTSNGTEPMDTASTATPVTGTGTEQATPTAATGTAPVATPTVAQGTTTQGNGTPVATPTAILGTDPVSTPTMDMGTEPVTATQASVTEEPTDVPTTETPDEGTVPQGSLVDLEVYDTSPTNSAMAVPTNFTTRFYFTEAYTSDLALTVTRENMSTGESSDFNMTLASSKTYAYAPMTATADTDYCLHLNVGDDKERHSTCFTTRQPCGVTVQAGYDIVVDEFGGTTLVVRTLNGLLEAYGDDLKIAMLFDGLSPSENFPIGDAKIAIGEYDDSSALKTPGWTSSATGCTVSDSGDFNCDTDEIIFPLPLTYEDGSYWQTLNLYLKGVNMNATANVSGNFTDLDAYVLTGYMLYDDVVRLAAAAGSEDIAQLVDLNKDSDGDGTDDAATFRLSTSPVPVALEGCTP